VLKKAGIVVSMAATGLLVMTPLASAQGVATPAQASNTCTFSQSGGQISQTLVGGSSVVGAGGAAVGVIAPTTTQTQAANCTAVSVSDVIDVNSNNVDRTSIRTRIENSFNRISAFRP